MAVVKRIRNGKVRWFARWWSGGREYRQATPSKQEASALAKKRSVEAFEGREFPGKRRRCTVTVKAQVADYIAAVKREKAAATADAYAYHAKHIENAPLGKLLIAEVRDLDIAAYRKARLGAKHPPSHASLNRELVLCRAALNMAVEHGLIPSNPFRKVKLLREPAGRTRMLVGDEEARLLEACSPRVRAIVTVALNTGARRGEITGLTWADVDLSSGFVHIRRAKPGATATKTHAARSVPMNATLHRLFAALCPADPDPAALVFATRSGKAYSNLRRDFAEACDRANVRDFRFHDCRHTAASRLVMAGVDIRTVAEVLGHRGLRMTMRYSHLSPAHIRTAVGRLDGSADRPATVTSTVTSADTPKVTAA
jgi:integrase